MRKRFAPAALAAGLVGGTALGAVAFGAANGALGSDSGLLAFQTDDTIDDTTADTSGGTTDTTVENDDAPAEADLEGRRTAWLTEALAPLVENGTITQAQADAVVAALEEAAPARGPGRGGHGHGRFGFGLGLEAAASALGITQDELRAELSDGSSVADVAAERGADPETVIDAVVTAKTAQIDDAVAAGNLTAERAAEIKAELAERVTAFVNGERPAGGLGRRGDFPRPDAADTTAETETTDTTTS